VMRMLRALRVVRIFGRVEALRKVSAKPRVFAARRAEGYATKGRYFVRPQNEICDAPLTLSVASRAADFD
jgi:hypothetical protein